ncbi:MAG: adenylyl-sulfate kinase [Streptosporangiaceae bacterium]
MTATAPMDPVIDHFSLPSVALTDRQLGDLELLLSGAFAPLAGFMTSAEAASVAERATLADGASFPVPVVLEVPAEAACGDAGHVLLADPEGTPIAVLAVTERTPGAGPGTVRLAGPVTGHRAPEHGPFRRLMLTPEQSRAALGDGPVLAFATRGPLGRRQIGQLRRQAEQLRARLLILPLVCGPAEVVRRPESLIRAVLAAAASLPAGTLVVPVPLGRPDEVPGPAGSRNEREVAVTAMVAASFGASHLMIDAAGPGAGSTLPAPIPVIPAGDWAYDPRAEVWRPLSLIEAGTEIGDLSADQLGDMLDTGAPIPPWFAPEAVTAELRHARPPRSSRGFVLFLTGLSGSGKSTIARDLRDLLAERSDRRVSLLDGDLVRSLLSAGLSFSRADRDLNVARIGFVAAEIAKHGGIAICAPIAPYAQARARVREMVSEVGDFLLIHVATPLEVCEQRDRKGLYAKARAGLIEQFTGVSDPYEEPDDAMLVLDTSVLSRERATESVLRMLVTGGWLAGR